MEKYYFTTADFNNNLVDTFRESFNHVNNLIHAGHGFHRMVILAGENTSMVSIQELLTQNMGLIRNNRVNRIPEIPLNVVFQTVRRYNVNRDFSDVVISYDLDSKELLKVEDQCSEGIVVNIEVRQYADINLWGGVWGVSSPANEENSYRRLNPRPIVRRALDQISRAINLGNRTAFHPGDDRLVKTIILALHHHFGIIDSDEVFAYVVRTHHWPIGIATILKKYFDTLNNGRHFCGGDRHKRRWQELLAGWQR